MFKGKTKITNKKQAQHILEFALVMPIFIMLFCFVFPLVVSAYSHFQTTYIFMKAVSNTINNQPTDETSSSYIFKDEIKRRMNNTVEAYVINAEQNAYIGGIASEEYQIFSWLRGVSYFNALITVNKAYVEPTVLNLNGGTLESDFTAYYDLAPLTIFHVSEPARQESAAPYFMGGYNE